MNHKIKLPKLISDKEIQIFFKKKIINLPLDSLLKNSLDMRFSKNPYPPDLKDLYILYKIITLNNRLSVLEYGCGWSSVIFYSALLDNKKRLNGKKYPRCVNPYRLEIIDDNKKYSEISKKRFFNYFKKTENVKFNFSKALMTEFLGRYCVYYKNHPLINPDFIYLDGPDQFSIKNKINGFTVAKKEFMPMSCDIIKYEHFLTPGTIIVIDGRMANVRFLKANFQRNWSYHYYEKIEMSVFYLNEKPLGKPNSIQLDFYKL